MAVVWPSVSAENTTTENHIYTYFPYTQRYCERVEPVRWNTVRQGHELVHSKRPIFPAKLSNLHQCPIVMATIDFYPYATIRNDTGTVEGMDVLVAEELARELNFSLKIEFPTDPHDRGTIFNRNNVTGVLGMVRAIVSAKYSFGQYPFFP